MLPIMFDNKTARWLREQGYDFPPKLVVSLSGGKDSTAMVHRMLEWGYPIDALVCFDGSWEFPQMYDHLNLMEKKTGLKINYVYPNRPFSELIKRYRWPDSRRRWCTAAKRDSIRKWINQRYNKKKDYIIHVIGYALDELDRLDRKENLKKGQVFYPLLNDFCWDPNPEAVEIAIQCMDGRDAAMQESDALQYCKDLGYDWGGLYENFSRVSCFCCPLKRKGDLRILRTQYPDLWKRALEMEASIPDDGEHYVTFRGKESLHQIDDRLSRVGRNISSAQEFEQGDLFGAAA